MYSSFRTVHLVRCLAIAVFVAAYWAAPAVACPMEGALYGVEWGFSGGPFYQIDKATGVGTLIGNTGYAGHNSAALGPAGELYSASGNILVTIDPATAATTSSLTLNVGDWRGLAFSPGGILYGIHKGPNVLDENLLYTIDVSSGIASLVGCTVGFTGLQGLAFSPGGTLYGWDVGRGSGIGPGLVTIDPSTAATSDVDPTVDGSGREVQSIVFAPHGTLYGAGNALYTIDATGFTTLVGGGGYSDIRGIWYVASCTGAIPEPATVGLLLMGLCGAALRMRHRSAA